MRWLSRVAEAVVEAVAEAVKEAVTERGACRRGSGTVLLRLRRDPGLEEAYYQVREQRMQGGCS
jgi:hypothetical protein